MVTRSYLKTIALATGASLGAAVVALAFASLTAGAVRTIGTVLAALACGLSASVALAGGVVLARWRRTCRGGTDWYLEQQARMRGRAPAVRRRRLRRWISRWLNGHDFLVGDCVRIRSYNEIQATLDADQCLEALPFQAEMHEYCERSAVVFRAIDKIYDYGRTRRMRRLRSCVVLEHLCCAGWDHGGCQARCRLIWKAAWLVRAPTAAADAPDTERPAPTPALLAARSSARYVCQFTQLQKASETMNPWGLLKELRPLVAGNVTASAFAVALATRWFNVMQRIRGGIGFPPSLHVEPSGGVAAEPELHEGECVVVRRYEEISATLDGRGKHRGLWFDADMRKYCGRAARVALKVERIIDNTTGEMRLMKTPCYVLDDVYYTGEFQSFGAQHEWLFWRQAWLRRAQQQTPAA